MNLSQISSVSLGYADRNDTAVVNMIPSFVKMVESRFNRVLTIEDQSTRYQFPTPNPTDGRYNLPTDFSSLQDIAIVSIASPSSRVTLAMVNPEQMNTVTGMTNQSIKGWYNIIAGQLVVQPVLTDDYLLEIVYYATIDPLTAPESFNWISTNHPDLYIYGILVEINSFVKDPDATNLWEARFQSAVAEVNAADDLLVWSGTSLFTHVG